MNWLYFTLLSAFFAAITAILAKIGVQNINSNLATAIRTVVVLIFAWVIVLVQGEYKQFTNISKKSLISLILSGITTGLSWLFYFRALQLGNASKVAPIDKLSLVLTIILAVIFLREKLTIQILLGGSLMAICAIIEPDKRWTFVMPLISANLPQDYSNSFIKSELGVCG